jgi:heptosyltransferase-2
MKQLLIVKCGAAGDVVRTTPLIHAFSGWAIDWLTAPEASELLPRTRVRRVLEHPDELDPSLTYDLAISLEDDRDYLGEVFSRLRSRKLFGAYIENGTPTYTPDSAEWFDLGLISRFGVREADARKLRNRSSYQEMIFRGLDLTFAGEPYILPEDIPPPDLTGDIAVAAKAGPRWPAKNWAYVDEFIRQMTRKHTVNILPARPTIKEHIADIKGHRVLVSGDSLPMHLAIGLGVPVVALFTCTSPWEIFAYPGVTKIISPVLEKYFYSRKDHPEATRAISVDQVTEAVTEYLNERR